MGIDFDLLEEGTIDGALEEVGEDRFDIEIGSVADIEKLILALKACDKKCAFLDELKKARDARLNEQKSKYQEKADYLREEILKAMTEHAPEDKKIDFPGVGAISRRKGSGKWEIEDEEKVIQTLKSDDKYAAAVKTKDSIVKKEFNKLFKEDEEVEGAKYIQPEKEVLTVKYDGASTKKASSGSKKTPVKSDIEKDEDIGF